ncbi:MAG TPA: dihydrolipoamide acetyltransferase family protein, partial [Gaiellaceae bacterium]|nr:dihydrolipoamide acetyltransferase family protein [Gaiellaceae bacterium]
SGGDGGTAAAAPVEERREEDEQEKEAPSGSEPQATLAAPESAVEAEKTVEAIPSGSEPQGGEGAAAEAVAPMQRTSAERVKASPLARRIARERGIDLATVAGTGPEGRVIAEDVEKAAAAPAAAPAPAEPAEVEVVELTSVRRTIARRLTAAWEAPVFQLTVTADASGLLSTRGQMVERLREGEVKPTVSDVLTRLVASALMRHRAVNAHFVDGQIHRYPTANVGIAVATEAGLMVPVIRSTERKSVQEIAAARADLVSRARGGKLQLSDLEDGTFTISNLGMYGIEQFIAVINPPQVAILAVGSIEDRAHALGGELVVRPTLTLTLTCDHRAIDGSEGAEFLHAVKALVEAPALAL